MLSETKKDRPSKKKWSEKNKSALVFRTIFLIVWENERAEKIQGYDEKLEYQRLRFIIWKSYD